MANVVSKALVIHKINMIEDDVIVKMPSVKMGGKDVFMLTFKISVCKFKTNLVSFFRCNFICSKGLNYMLSKSKSAVFGQASCLCKFFKTGRKFTPKVETKSISSVFFGLVIYSIACPTVRRIGCIFVTAISYPSAPLTAQRLLYKCCRSG